MPALAGVLILFASFSLSKNPLARLRAQKPQKVIAGEALSRPEREPVIITDVKLGTRPVNLNVPFDHDDDEWIKNLSFKVKNHSSRTVTYVGVDLFFSDDTTGAPAMVRQLRFGQRPLNPNPRDGVLSLKPGDSLDVSMQTQYESLKKFIEMKQPIGRVNKTMIRIYLVFFDDGTKWDLGNFYVPDSGQPTGFRRIDPPPGLIRNN
jgi:hypothetical protein